MNQSPQKTKPTKQSTIIGKLKKPTALNFTGTKSPTNFKPNARFQSINRSRR